MEQNMIEKLKKALRFILYCGQDAEFFLDNIDEIQRHNEKLMHTMSICSTVLLICFTMATQVFELRESLGVLLVFSAISLVFTVEYIYKGHVEGGRTGKYISWAIQRLMLLVGFFILYTLYAAPGDLEVLTPVILALFIVSFIVKPINMLIYILFMSLGLSAIAGYTEVSREAITYNLVNYLVALLLGMIIGYSNTSSKLHMLAKELECSKNKDLEINMAQQIANQDPLTRLGSRIFYERERTEMTEWIKNSDEECQFAIIECDTNNLKEINDVLGHQEGDYFLIICARLITEIYSKSKVFRIGGDEFAIVLTGEDYDNREELLEKLRDVGDIERYSFASGLAVYDPSRHKNFSDVFLEADQEMFKYKDWQKKQRSGDWMAASIKYYQDNKNNFA